MAHIHADGTEETRPRTPEEVAAIEHEMRLAARSNVRSGSERRQGNLGGPISAGGENGRLTHFSIGRDRRSGNDQRAVMSLFEREFFAKEDA